MPRRYKVHGLTLVSLFANFLCVSCVRDNACTKALPTALRSTLRDELCGLSSPGHAGPAVCAVLLRKAYPQWHPTAIVNLCQGSLNEDPATCAAAFAHHKGAGSAAALDHNIIIGLCRPFANPPLVNGVATFDSEGDEELQRRLQGPSQCVAGAPKGWAANTPDLVVELCGDAQGSLDGAHTLPPAAQCAVDALKHPKLRSALKPAAAAQLCRRAGGARGEGPLECALALPPDLVKSAAASASSPSAAAAAASAVDTIVGVCATAQDEVPAKCFGVASAAMGHKKGGGSSSSSTSASASGAAGKQKKTQATHNDVPRSSAASPASVALCRGARTLAPARCVASPSLASFDPELRVALCSSNDDDGKTPNDAVSSSDNVPRLDKNDGVAACVRAAPRELQQKQHEQSSSLSSSSLLVRLCKGAQGASPSQCLSKAPPSLSLHERVELCRKAPPPPAGVSGGGSGGGGPAACFKAIRTLRVSAQDPADKAEALRLCQGSTGEGPALCLEASPRDLPLPQRVDLCLRALNSAPAECAHRARHKLGEHEKQGVLVELCAGVQALPPPPPPPPPPLASSAAAKKKATRNIKLEEAPRSFGGPSDCAVAASQMMPRVDSASLVVLCKGADVRAAFCAAAASPAASSASFEGLRSSGWQQDGGGGDGGVQGRKRGLVGLSEADRCLLCARARSDVPAKCAAESPGAKALLQSSSASSASSVRGGGGDGTGGGGQRLARLCGGASSVTPGLCARHAVKVLLLGSLDDAFLEKCKRAVSLPSALRIDKMWWDGGVGGGGGATPSPSTAAASPTAASAPASSAQVSTVLDERGSGLFAGRLVHVSLSVLSQFGTVLNRNECAGCDLRAVVVSAVASVAKDTVGVGGDLEGIRTNTSNAVEGRVEFHRLRFSSSGQYDLKFTLASFGNEVNEARQRATMGATPKTVAVRVRVEQHSDDLLGPLGRCGQMLYPLLHSFAASAPFSPRDGGGGGGKQKVMGSLLHGGEETAFVPASRVWDLMPLLPPPALFHPQPATGSSSGGGDITDAMNRSGDQLNLKAGGGKSEGDDDDDDVNLWNSGGVDNDGGGDGGGGGGLECSDVLAAVGAKLVVGWGGDVWVTYRPVVFAVDMEGGAVLGSHDGGQDAGGHQSDGDDGNGGAGGGGSSSSSSSRGLVVEGFEIPHVSMDDYQRLGLDNRPFDGGGGGDGGGLDDDYGDRRRESGSSSGGGRRKDDFGGSGGVKTRLRDLKRAYYRHSLLWHPDRWVGYPLAFRRRAMNCFQLISEAYRRLNEAEEERRNEGEEGEREWGGKTKKQAGAIPLVIEL